MTTVYQARSNPLRQHPLRQVKSVRDRDDIHPGFLHRTPIEDIVDELKQGNFFHELEIISSLLKFLPTVH